MMLIDIQDRYEEFMRMTRQWQNLHLLLRAGRAHAEGPDRIGDTKPGECALLCPACPQPEKNLPPDWKDAPAEKAYAMSSYLR
jgi:hypothetical protein